MAPGLNSVRVYVSDTSDVSIFNRMATDNYICYDGTCAGGWGGTSFAAPRWAAFVALVNQETVASGYSTLGFINPALYTIGLGSSYSTAFHDITSGSNGTMYAPPPPSRLEPATVP